MLHFITASVDSIKSMPIWELILIVIGLFMLPGFITVILTFLYVVLVAFFSILYLFIRELIEKSKEYFKSRGIKWI